MSIQLHTASDNFLRCLPKSERQGIKTAEEIAVGFDLKGESILHRQVTNLLRLRDIRFVHAQFGRKVRDLPIGYPDVQVFIGSTVGFIELKTLEGKLSEEQKDWQTYLLANGFKYCVATDLEQVGAALSLWGGKEQ